MGYKSYNKAIKAKLEAHVTRGMTRVAITITNDIKESINRGNITGLNPSLPGEPPKKVTGQLQNAIGFEVGMKGGDVIAKVGVLAGSIANNYAAGLEFGTSKIAERPFIRPAIFNNSSKIIEIIRRG